MNREPGHVIDITITSLDVHQVTLSGKHGVDEGKTKLDKDYNQEIPITLEVIQIVLNIIHFLTQI